MAEPPGQEGEATLGVRLPRRIVDKIMDFPESSMGAHSVALILSDGRLVEDVDVAWGDHVVRVAGEGTFDLSAEDIADVLNRANERS
jgi:hypothetical protein